MNKFYLLTLMTVFIFSCDNAEKVKLDNAPAPGYLVTADGTKIPARNADPANLEIWEKYIDAHNKRDLATIASMNHDSILINTWDGRNIKGNEAHLELLKQWFEEGNPQWNTFFSYSMKVDGQNGEWVIAGMEITDTVDSEDIVFQDVTDSFIVDGKIRRVIVYRKEN
jgi:hypothetical protein